MPQGPAARVTDPVSHPLPPILTGGPGSVNVNIGFLPAWRGLPLAAVAALQSAKSTSDAVITAAETANKAAAGTPGAPAAFAAMGAAIGAAAGAGSDIHQCATPSPVPPHGPGVVIDGSATVLINNMPACRMGDSLLEAIGPPNKIAKGDVTVLIGG
jgi:hypothetical protein